jgi:hypothetical protein
MEFSIFISVLTLCYVGWLSFSKSEKAKRLRINYIEDGRSFNDHTVVIWIMSTFCLLMPFVNIIWLITALPSIILIKLVKYLYTKSLWAKESK